MPGKIQAIAYFNLIGCTLSLVLWFWFWRRTRRAVALVMYGTQGVVLAAACLFLLRSPAFPGTMEARLFFSIMSAAPSGRLGHC